MSQLATALRTLSEAMRDNRDEDERAHKPDDDADPDGDAEDERQVKNSDVPRPMGYFMGERTAKVTQQRAHNAADDSPLVPRAVLLAPPTKKAAA